MPAVRIGIHLPSLGQPLKKALQTAARLGATGIEIDARTQFRPEECTGTALRQIRKLLNDLGLRACAVSFPTRRGYNVESDLDRRVAATKEAMKMAYQLGAKVVVNDVGQIPDEPQGHNWDLLVETLDDLGRYGDKVGANLAARTGSADGPTLARLIEAIPDGGIGIDLDPGGWIVNGHSPLESVPAIARHVTHVHARDAARDFAAGHGQEVPLGRGTAEFPLLMAALENYGYRGFFTIQRQQSDDPINEIALAVEFLRNTWQG